MKNFLVKMCMICIGGFSAILGPTFVFVFHGTRTTTIEITTPFTEENSWLEYAVNLVLQTITISVGVLFYTGMEVIMEMFSNTITILP